MGIRKRRLWGWLLALCAAALAGALAALADAGAATVVWRGFVTFAAVYIYQRALCSLWASFTENPIACPAQRATTVCAARRDRARSNGGDAGA